MNVAIVNPIRRRFSGGYAKYLSELVPRLVVDARIGDLTVWLPDDVTSPDLAAPLVRRWSGLLTRQGIRELHGRVRAAATDVVFVPTARHVPIGDVPTVVMVRNMEPLTRPVRGNDIGEALRNLARAEAARRACRRAARVIAVSTHVQQFLSGRWGIPSQQIGVVYHGVRPVPESPSVAQPAMLQALQGRRFLFTAGSLRAARGLEDLIAALPAIASQDVVAVIAGTWDPGAVRYRRKITALVRALAVADRVLWTGQLSNAEMDWCFANCAAFIMTTRAEACPNTALEALAHGCAIASTAEPPMPEFLGEEACYYTTGDARALAKCISELLTRTSGELARRRARAVERSGRFTWEKTVDGTIEQLQMAAGAAVIPSQTTPVP